MRDGGFFVKGGRLAVRGLAAVRCARCWRSQPGLKLEREVDRLDKFRGQVPDCCPDLRYVYPTDDAPTTLSRITRDDTVQNSSRCHPGRPDTRSHAHLPTRVFHTIDIPLAAQGPKQRLSQHDALPAREHTEKVTHKSGHHSRSVRDRQTRHGRRGGGYLGHRTVADTMFAHREGM